MDLEKLEKMVRLVLRDLTNEHRVRSEYNIKQRNLPYASSFKTMKINGIAKLEARVRNLMSIAQKSLPNHQELFAVTHRKIDDKYNELSISDAISVLQHFLEILEIEKLSEAKIKEMKVFESADEKMKQAALSFRKDDYPSTFHSLNTALELVLKDKVEIPTTFTKINTSNIIDILAKYKVEPYLYLTEARKRVLMIDNKIKHQAYSPTKIDCINGIKAMEELISKLRDKEMKLTEEIKNKIYEGL